MNKKFRDLLHKYKVEAFKIAHHGGDPASAEQIHAFTEQALNTAFHYHFRKDPDPERLETFRMIKNFTLEAVLPPVIDKIMQRVVSLEQQHEQLVKLVDGLLEALSQQEEEPQRKREVV